MKRLRRGFTLVEMIVAGFLLSVAVVGAITALSTVTRVNGKAEVMQTSGLLAHQRFSELAQQSESISGGDQQGDFGSGYVGYRWQQTVEATDYPNLFKITLTITWGDGNTRPEQYQYTTFMRNDENTTDQQIRDQQQQQQGTTGATTGG